MKKHKIKLAVCSLLAYLLLSPAFAMAATNPCTNTDTNNRPDPTKVQNCVTQSPVVQDIQKIVDWLGAGVGIVVTAAIIMGGIQYSLAGDNTNAVSAAKQRMLNGVIALFVFLFAFAFLQWLIPGGIFK